MAEQREGKIAKTDRDYLRTIETMTVFDLTRALISMSESVARLSRNMWYFWIPVGLTFLAVVIKMILG